MRLALGFSVVLLVAVAVVAPAAHAGDAKAAVNGGGRPHRAEGHVQQPYNSFPWRTSPPDRAFDDRRPGFHRGQRVFPGPVYVISEPRYCVTPGYWTYQWIPQQYTSQEWVPAQYGPDGRTYYEGHYEPRTYVSGYYQPYWVPDASTAC